MSIIRLTTILLLSIVLNACVYTNIKMPLDTDVSNTELGTKIGKASNQSVMWLVAWGDGGTEAAARNGDIAVIKHLDVERLVILFGLYTKITTVAYGD